jgi:hypothetical protein
VQQFFDKFDLEDSDDEGKAESHVEKGNSMERDAYLTNLLFGTDSVVPIKGLNIVKFNMFANELEDSIRDLYQMKPKVAAQLNVHFAPDYVKNPKEPEVHYKKPEINPETEKSGFGEQLEGMAKRFIAKRWKTMHDKKDKEPVASTPEDKTSLLELVAAKKELYPFNDVKLKYVPFKPQMTRKEQLEVVEKYLKQSRPQLAIAHALVYTDWKVDAAALMYKDAGGELDGHAQLVSYSHDHDESPNFILELITYLVLRMPTLTENCVICDDEITVQFAKNKPTLCTKFMCQFDFVMVHICSTIPMVST